MEKTYNISIDGFELTALIYSDYKSSDFEIINLFDLDTMDSIDIEFYDLIMSEFEDDIKEDIQQQVENNLDCLI